MKKIVIVGSWPDYEEIFFDIKSNAEYDINVENFKKEKILFFDIGLFHKKIRNFFIYRRLENILKKYKDSIFIFQDNELIIDFIIKENVDGDFRFLFRNTVSSKKFLENKIFSLKNKRCKIFSFDRGDCDKYGFYFYNSFAKVIDDIETKNINDEFDAIFIGRDKGRSSLLYKLKEQMGRLGYSVEIDLRGDGKNNKQVSYVDYLRKTLQAKVIIDIVKDGQVGLTVRPIEALLYNKKLITNNKNIYNYDFYDSRNIFILSEDFMLEDLDMFMKSNYSIISDEIKNKYKSENVIKNIVSK